MKKAKIIVPAIALLALGVAGSSLGTVAWFVTANNATVSAGTLPTGTITSQKTEAEVGAFTITPLFTAPEVNVDLTDPADGKSYVFDSSITSSNVAENGSSHKIAVTPQTPHASLTSCGYNIKYAGSASSVATIQAEWAAAAQGKNKLTFSLDGDGTNANLIRFGASADENNVVTGADYSWTQITSVTFGNDILTSNGQTFALSPATILVSLTGSDTAIQTASDVYTVKMSVAIAA